MKFQDITITKSTKKLTLKNQNVEIDIVQNSSVKAKVNLVKIKNKQLKQALNTSIYKLHELVQCGRRESIRIHGIPESGNNKNDSLGP